MERKNTQGNLPEGTFRGGRQGDLPEGTFC
jgi:hypothetical protein